MAAYIHIAQHASLCNRKRCGLSQTVRVFGRVFTLFAGGNRLHGTWSVLRCLLVCVANAKLTKKTERFNRMLDVCVAAEDFLGAERIFQRQVILGTLVVSFGLLIADMVVDFLATVFALLFWWYDWGMLQAFRGTSSICRFFILDTKKTPEKYFRIKCILADTKTQ